MADSADLSKGLERAFEDEILAAPPSVRAGLTERHDGILAEMGIDTIKHLRSDKYSALACVLVELQGETR